MRKLIFSFCFLLAALAIQAAPLKGLRIESTGQPIIVFVDGTQVCTASTSCFVANLSGGLYKVEVFAVAPGRRGEAGVRAGELLYSERVHYLGWDVHDITIGGRPDNRPDDRQRGRETYYDVMSQDAFDRFFRSVKENPFPSDKLKLIETALVTSCFTSDQCKRITDMYTFDDEKMKVMKMMYPKIVDKSNFFLLIDSLVFSTNKDKMSEFVKGWHGK